MPWSPAPSSFFAPESTPCAISADWPCSRMSTLAVSQWKPDLLVADVLDGGPRRVVDLLWVTEAGPRVSPAITTRLVVASVSQATRTCPGSKPCSSASR